MAETANIVNWTDIATAIGGLIAAVTLLVGLALAFIQLRSINRAREIEAITDRSRRWEEDSLVQARLSVSRIGDARELWNYLNGLEPGKSEEWFLYMRIPHFFEDIGVSTLHSKALKKELVYELFAPPIELYWGWYRTFMEEYRKKLEDERLFEWFEKLAVEMLEMKSGRR